MAMSAVLKVDLGIVRGKLDSFSGKRQTLMNVMQQIRTVMQALAAVSWISPAARALLQKFLQLYKQIEEAIRIVDEYIHDLGVVIEQYTAIEQRLQEKAQALPTDIFGI